MKKLFISVLTILTVFAVWACGEDTMGQDPPVGNDDFCSKPLNQEEADEAMERLLESFLLVDVAFNASENGLNPAEVATFGYYTEDTQTVALGPFAPLGPLGPGAISVEGIIGSSNLQSFFEGGLKQAFGPDTTLVHLLPTVSAIISANNRRATVNSRADVFDDEATLVAIVRGLAQYTIPCEGVPTIDWIFFTIEAGPSFIPEDAFLPDPNE